MNWTPLTHYPNENLERGLFLKFSAPTLPEKKIITMICEEMNTSGLGKALITVSGYKAGISYFVVFPINELDNGNLKKKWLIDNWQKWVYADCTAEEVYVSNNFLFLN